MGRTACTEPQCLYSTAIPLLPYGPYGLYRASVPVPYLLHKIRTAYDKGLTSTVTKETYSASARQGIKHVIWNTRVVVIFKMTKR